MSSSDLDKYRVYVDHLDLSEDKKIKLIHTVWLTLQNGIDRALGNDSVQVCLDLKAEKIVTDSADMIELEILDKPTK